MRWYTAVGVKMDQPGGSFCVQVGAEKKILSGMEIYIWNALLWSFVEETQIYERMVQLLKAVFPGKNVDEKTGKMNLISAFGGCPDVGSLRFVIVIR